MPELACVVSHRQELREVASKVFLDLIRHVPK